MATKKSEATKPASQPEKGNGSSTQTGNDHDDTAKAAFDHVKDAIPSMEGVAGDVRDYVQENVNVDIRGLADDATEFVRRNPGTSLAAAAGIGILIGILATKRS